MLMSLLCFAVGQEQCPQNAHDETQCCAYSPDGLKEVQFSLQ